MRAVDVKAESGQMHGAGNAPKVDDSKKTWTNPNTGQAGVADRSKIIGSAASTNIDLRPEGRIRGGAPRHNEAAKDVRFSESLRKQYTEFLTNYVNNVGRMMVSNDPAVRTAIYDARHLKDRQLLELLSNEVVHRNPDNTEWVEYILDEKKVQTYLFDEKGLDYTNNLMVRLASEEMSAMALAVSLMPPAQRERMITEFSQHTGDDEGRLRRWFNERVGPWMGSPIGETGGRPYVNQPWVWGAFGVVNPMNYVRGVGNLINNLPQGILVPLNLIPGGQVSLPLAVLGHTLRAGVRMTAQQSVDMYNSLAGDAAERTFLANMSNVHMDDFQLNGAGTAVELVPGRTPLTDFFQARDSIVSKLHTRQEYIKKAYEGLHVRPELLDGVPEQEIYNMISGRFEQPRTDFDRRVLERFQQGGNLDVNPANAAFEIFRYRQAREAVLAEDMNDFFRRNFKKFVKKENFTDEGAQSLGGMIDKEYEGRKEATSKIIDDRKKEYQRVIDETLTPRRTSFENEQQRFTSFQTAVTNVENARRDLNRVIGGIQVNIGGIGWAAPANIDQAIEQIRIVREQASPAGGPVFQVNVGGRVINSIVDERMRIDTWLAAQYVAIDGANPRGPNEPEETYRDKINRLRKVPEARAAGENRQVDALDTILQNWLEGNGQAGQVLGLQSAQNNLTNAENALENTTDLVRNYMESTREQITQFESITGPWQIVAAALPPPPAGLTQVDLLTLDVDEIMGRINRVNGANAALGWPETQNNRTERRLQIIRAMNEARARQLSVALTLPQNPFAMAWRAYGITDNDILLRDNAGVLVRINEQRALRNLAPLVMGAALSAGIDIVRTRIRSELPVRIQAFTQNITALNETIAQQNDRVQNVEQEFTAQRENMQRTKALTDRIVNGEINLRASDFTQEFVGPAGAPAVFDAPINPGDPNLMTAERNLTFIPAMGGAPVPVPRGCLDFYDVLFGYRDLHEGTGEPPPLASVTRRNEFLQQITQLVPPIRLAAYLNDYLNLGIGANPDLDVVITAIRLAVNNGDRGSADFRWAFRNIVNDVARTQLATLT